MPRIFDNIEDRLLPILQETLSLSDRADFCVGCLYLRNWKALDSSAGQCSRDELRRFFTSTSNPEGLRTCYGDLIRWG